MNVIGTLLVSSSDSSPQIDWDEMLKEQDRKPWILDEDPLALSWCSWRIAREGQCPRPALESCEPTEQDRVMANKMRQYFRDNIGFQLLRGTTVSRFRRELYELLTGGPCQQRHQGMVWRLPEFYVEDQDRIAIRDRFLDANIDWDRYRNQTQELQLQPVKRIVVTRQHHKSVQFWFQDQHGAPLQWSVDSHNCLFELVQGIWETSPCARISAHGVTTRCWVGNDSFPYVRIARARILAL